MSSSFSETNRISLIWQHPLYQKHCEKIQELEKDRIFCRHTPEHFLDVARLMYIYSLENKLNLSREIIYATALLHDIGRAQQYLSGISHDIAGAEIAGKILQICILQSRKKRKYYLRSVSTGRMDLIMCWLCCYIRLIKSPEIVFHVQQLQNVTGLLRKKSDN